MRYDAVLATLTRDGEDWRAEIPEDWLQGRSAFGGLQAALGLRAMREALGADTPLRSLQTSFIAPVPAGPLRISAAVLRRGKSATQVEARLYDGDEIACVLLGIFGAARDSAIRIEPSPPEVPALTAAHRELPYLPGLTPAFTQHLRMRWARGAPPFSGISEARMQVLLDLRERGAVGEAEVLALADAIPSPGLSLLKKPAFASSLTWTLELLDQDFSGDGDWLMDAEVSAGRDGYLCQTATLWSPRRRAIALSRQTVVVFG